LPPIVVRNGEKGQKLSVQVIDENNQPYSLTGKKVVFDDQIGKDIVSDNDTANFQINSDGSFVYTMIQQAFNNSGSAWFRITDTGGNVIDTTQTFDIKVLSGLSESGSQSYVENLNNAIDQANAALQAIYKARDTADSTVQDIIDKQLDNVKDLRDAALKRLDEDVKAQSDTWQTTFTANLADLTTKLQTIETNAQATLTEIKQTSDSVAKLAEDNNANLKKQSDQIVANNQTSLAALQQQGADIVSKIDANDKLSNALKEQVKAFLAAIPSDPTYRGPKGEQGNPGQGISVKGRVETIDQLPKENNQEGDAYFVATVLYMYLSGKWENLGNIQGPQGLPGKTGDPGPKGEKPKFFYSPKNMEVTKIADDHIEVNVTDASLNDAVSNDMLILSEDITVDGKTVHRGDVFNTWYVVDGIAGYFGTTAVNILGPQGKDGVTPDISITASKVTSVDPGMAAVRVIKDATKPKETPNFLVEMDIPKGDPGIVKTATTNTAGVVKPDGKTISVAEDGTITSIAEPGPKFDISNIVDPATVKSIDSIAFNQLNVEKQKIDNNISINYTNESNELQNITLPIGAFILSNQQTKEYKQIKLTQIELDENGQPADFMTVFTDGVGSAFHLGEILASSFMTKAVLHAGNTHYGVVKPDGTTITADDGVISAVGGGEKHDYIQKFTKADTYFKTYGPAVWLDPASNSNVVFKDGNKVTIDISINFGFYNNMSTGSPSSGGDWSPIVTLPSWAIPKTSVEMPVVVYGEQTSSRGDFPRAYAQTSGAVLFQPKRWFNSIEQIVLHGEYTV
jgi:hypothetical protein